MEAIVYIFLDGTFVPAGRISFEEEGRNSRSIFAYGRGYLKNPKALPIDPIELPLSESQFETEVDFPVFNAIRDAGPDRWGRYLIGKRFPRDLNELEYILAGGEGRVGALAFGPDLNGPKVLGPEGFEAYTPQKLELAEAQKGADDALANADTEELERLLKYGPSIGGARPKIALNWQGRPSIAKFSTSLDERNEPLIEYATMTLAKAVGVNIPRIELTEVLGRDVYIIERFDRRLFKGEERKLLFLSGLTAGGLHESDAQHWSYQHLCDAITRISRDPKADKRELFGRMVFNILVNNDDDHPRNHGFIGDAEGGWRLSPAYDIAPRAQATLTFRLAMNVGEFGKEASRRNALSRCHHFELEAAEAEAIWARTEGSVLKKWRTIFTKAGLSAGEIEKFATSISAKP